MSYFPTFSRYLDYDKTKCVFNDILRLERVFSEKSRLHTAKQSHETRSRQITVIDIFNHEAFVAIKDLI